jgi:hypothetical protein
VYGGQKTALDIVLAVAVLLDNEHHDRFYNPSVVVVIKVQKTVNSLFDG